MQHHSLIELNSTASSVTSDSLLLTPPIPFAAESIKPSTKLNEKMSKMKRYDDKFSSKIDDEKDNGSMSSECDGDEAGGVVEVGNDEE
jgi:hypothetical protein